MLVAVSVLFLILLSGCVSTPQVDSFALPHYASVTLRDAGIADERQAFAEIFCSLIDSDLEPSFSGLPCGDFLHLDGPVETAADVPELNRNQPLKVIVVPGLLGDCLSRFSTPFQDARRYLATLGIESELLAVGGRASSEHNASIIAKRLEAPELRSGPPVVLIGYSKGVADTLEALPRVAGGLEHVAAVVSVAGVVNGSLIASEQAQFMRGLFDSLPMRDCAASAEDGDAIASLTYEHRQDWLQNHPLPEGPRYFSIAAYAARSAMSRVNGRTYRQLARIDARNDGLLIYRDALLPRSTLLAFPNADHLAVALPFDSEDGFLISRAVNRNAYPRTALLMSLLAFVQRELDGGLQK